MVLIVKLIQMQNQAHQEILRTKRKKNTAEIRSYQGRTVIRLILRLKSTVLGWILSNLRKQC